jgi:hypothetical protein
LLTVSHGQGDDKKQTEKPLRHPRSENVAVVFCTPSTVEVYKRQQDREPESRSVSVLRNLWGLPVYGFLGLLLSAFHDQWLALRSSPSMCEKKQFFGA